MFTKKSCAAAKKIKAAEPEEVVKKESTTDPDCGLFVKGEHKQLAINTDLFWVLK